MSKKRWIFLFFFLCCWGLLFFISFENVVFKSEELNYLAIYLEDEQINYIPNRESGYTLDLTKSSCNNGVTISFDYNTWSVKTNYSNYTNTDNTRVKCNLYFTDKYIEPLLNGTDPVLEEPLIPVTIDSDGVVRKADLASEWYDYETKKWANAVILEDESESYASNEIIPEENIESYFVWIPKYRYQLWDLGLYDSLTTIDTNKVHEIPVIFGDYNTSDSVSGECTTPMESGATGNCQVGDYMTHPAFLSIPSTGFWVGKFSTGYKGATTLEEARHNVNDISKIIIKPNVYSWGRVQVANAHLNGYNYKRELDSHMIKNTEWGAIAYLAYSSYGIHTKIRINNNSSYITGYQANNEPTCGYTGINEECNINCNDNTCNAAYPNSVLASTTGNISGIFDMVGQSTITMSFMMYTDGSVTVGRNSNYHSGFNGVLGDGTIISNGVELPDSKYYDLYLYSNDRYSSMYNRRILGDATGELGPMQNINGQSWVILSWNNALISQYFATEYPVAERGYSVGGGYYSDIMAFQGSHGRGGMAYRIILTPTANTL